MSQQYISAVVPAQSVILHGTTDDLASSDTASTAMPVDSDCSSPVSMEISVGTSGSEETGQVASVAKNNVSFGTNEHALAQVINHNSVLLDKPKRPYQLSSYTELAWRSSRSMQEENSTYTTQAIEQSLSTTRELLQKLDGLHEIYNDLGFDIWKQLKLSLEKLEIRSANPKPKIKAKYLNDVEGFKARVAKRIQDHNESFRDYMTAYGTDSEIIDIPKTWSPQRLLTGAIIKTIDEQPRKRRRLSSSDISTLSRGPPDVCVETASPSISRAVSEETENFLDQLGEEIYTSILSNLCLDNMRGSFCRAPMTCIDNCQFFACPDFAIHQKCPHEKDNVFSHSGFKHTVQGCTAHHRNECKMKHPNGQRCRVRVVFFHIRASCMSVRGGRFVCRTMPCFFGHDNPDIRKAVMARDR